MEMRREHARKEEVEDDVDERKQLKQEKEVERNRHEER